MVTASLGSEIHEILDWHCIGRVRRAGPPPQGPPANVEGRLCGMARVMRSRGRPLNCARAAPPVPAGVNIFQIPPGTKLPPGLQLPPGTQLAPPPVSLTASTNAEGRFQIQNVPPGDYRVYATRETGYVPGELGQRSPTGEGLPLSWKRASAIREFGYRWHPWAPLVAEL